MRLLVEGWRWSRADVSQRTRHWRHAHEGAGQGGQVHRNPDQRLGNTGMEKPFRVTHKSCRKRLWVVCQRKCWPRDQLTVPVVPVVPVVPPEPPPPPAAAPITTPPTMRPAVSMVVRVVAVAAKVAPPAPAAPPAAPPAAVPPVAVPPAAVPPVVAPPAAVPPAAVPPAVPSVETPPVTPCAKEEVANASANAAVPRNLKLLEFMIKPFEELEASNW